MWRIAWWFAIELFVQEQSRYGKVDYNDDQPLFRCLAKI